MRNLIISILALGVVSFAQAEDHWYQGASLGYMLWDNERFTGSDDTGGRAGLQVGYEFYNSSAAVELAASTDLSGAEVDLYEISLINFLEGEGKYRPYWLAGFALSEGESTDIVEDSFSGVIGVGLSGYIDDRMEIRGDARVYPAIDSDVVSGIVDWGVNLAINYHFGDRSSSSPAPAPAPAPAAEPARRAAPAPAPAAADVAEARTITIRLNVEFANNSAEVAAVYGDEIQEVANAMAAQSDLELQLEGHTDSAGSEAYNQGLSQRRVDAVKDVLVAEYGIDANRVTSVGYGESRPIADNATADGRARNRRVVGVISWDEVVE